MNKKLPTSVFLDLDDTLYFYRPCHEAGLKAAFELMVKELRITQSEAKGIYETGRKHIKRRLGLSASGHSRLLYFREGLILKGMGSQATLCYGFEATYWNFFMEQMALKKGVRKFMDTLKAEKIPIFMVTDLTDQIQLRKLIALKLENIFDEVISSELAGGDKLTMKPFELLLSLIPIEILERPIFIGDSIQDFPQLNNIDKSKLKSFSFSDTSEFGPKIQNVKSFYEIQTIIFNNV
jgi:FMN phosphatase YigB (HAD superfamily)